MYQEAAQAYLRGAECYKKLKSAHELCSAITKAADMMAKHDPAQGAALYEQAVELYLEEGKFNTGAKWQQEIAKIYEAEKNFEEAIEAYTKAAEYYESDGNSSSRRDQCLETVATLCGEKEVGRYDKASELFEELGVAAAGVNLKKFSARKHFMNCIMCHLARPDVVGARQACEKAKTTDYTFGTSREGELCEALVTATEQDDSDAFGAAAKAFDDISKMPPWLISVLYQAKSKMDGGDGAGGDFGGGASADDGQKAADFGASADAPDMDEEGLM